MNRPQNFVLVTETAWLLGSHQEVLGRFKFQLENVMEEKNQRRNGDGSSSCLPRPLLSLILLSLCHSPVRKVYFTLAVFTNFLLSAGLPVDSQLSAGLHKFEAIVGVLKTQNSEMAKWY